jgi:carbonic anhydrase
MSYIEEMLEFNKRFVEEGQYKSYPNSKLPNKKIAVLTCMDTRLVELLPAALNIKNGDVKIIKNAGALVSHPFGSVMRSLLIAIYALGVEEVVVISHYGCGVQGMECSQLVGKMLERGISQEKIDFVRSCGIDLDKWLEGFDCVETSVHETVNIIKNHPLIPANVNTYGFVMDPETGQLYPIS